MSVYKSNYKSRYASFLERVSEHHKKHNITVRSRRYVRGTINAQIQERIHVRDNSTTDVDIRHRVFAKTGNTCYLCHRKYTANATLAAVCPHVYFHKAQLDHIVPVDKHGANVAGNYLLTCDSCNRIKSNKSIAEVRPALQRAKIKRLLQRTSQRWETEHSP